MKRTAGVFVLLASIGGCMHADRSKMPAQFSMGSQNKFVAKYQGPYGEPIVAGNTPRDGMSPGIVNASYVGGTAPKPGTDLIQAGFLNPGCSTCGVGHGLGHGGHGADKVGMDVYRRYSGVPPVPAMGPPGAVAAIGALPAYGPQIPTNMRSSIRFTAPEEVLGYKVTWLGANGWHDTPLIAPARYNFLQGGVYRLKVTSVPGHLDKTYYPTLEVLPGSPKTMTYLAHSSVPVTFTNEDFEQVDAGNMLVKVVYLPDPHNQELATIVGPNELVSTRLEPGLDPIIEAQKRGSILLIVRMGNIDLQTPNSPALDAAMPNQARPMFEMIPGTKGKFDEKSAPPKILIPNVEEGKKPATLPILPD